MALKKISYEEGIRSSIEKWEKIRKEVKKYGYIDNAIYRFWSTCGYCDSFGIIKPECCIYSCINCPDRKSVV